MTEKVEEIIRKLRSAALDKDNFSRMNSERWLPVGLGLEAADTLAAAAKIMRDYLASFDRCGGSTAISPEEFAEHRQNMRDFLTSGD